MADKSKVHEPLFRIKKNDGMPAWKTWAVRLGAVAVSLIICSFVIVLLTDVNPVEFFVEMIEGSFGDSKKVFKMLQSVAILLCISLAVTPAFKMKSCWSFTPSATPSLSCPMGKTPRSLPTPWASTASISFALSR